MFLKLHKRDSDEKLFINVDNINEIYQDDLLKNSRGERCTLVTTPSGACMIDESIDEIEKMLQRSISLIENLG